MRLQPGQHNINMSDTPPIKYVLCAFHTEENGKEYNYSEPITFPISEETQEMFQMKSEIAQKRVIKELQKEKNNE